MIEYFWSWFHWTRECRVFIGGRGTVVTVLAWRRDWDSETDKAFEEACLKCEAAGFERLRGFFWG